MSLAKRSPSLRVFPREWFLNDSPISLSDEDLDYETKIQLDDGDDYEEGGKIEF